jgi:hypothetical protein
MEAMQATPAGAVGLREDERNVVAFGGEARQGPLCELRGARKD